jgi:NTP pyrophosphatase (non-canonical NTP hydrolase)
MSDIFKNYEQFVSTLLSNPSKDISSFNQRIEELKGKGCNINTLLTAAVGMSAESGEFLEVVKKITFQGKEWNDENQFHLLRELGDIMFYIQCACLALNITMEDIFIENVNKLESRYPGGTFDVFFSENRKEGDL